MQRRVLSRWMAHFVDWRFAVYLIAGFAVAIVGMLVYVERLQEQLVRSAAIQHAELQARSLSEFRTLYTSEVVVPAMRAGVQVTHDYGARPNAIPLPATLSILLGQRIGEDASGTRVHLYSPYPFPWRKASGGLRDDFGTSAWQALGTNAAKPYYRFENMDGRMTLRYATADVMRTTCISCHNSNPDSPKRDWKAGDVRGILEVDLPVDSQIRMASHNLRGMFTVLVAFALAGTVGIGLVIRKLLHTSDELQQRVEVRTAELRKEVEERKRAELAAESANQAKSTFLANMSHEIRTPLNAVLGFAQLMRRDKGLSPAQHDTVAIIERAGSHLLGLINDILDLSKIEAGAMTLHLGDFDLGELLGDIDHVFTMRCRQKHLEWCLENGCGAHMAVHGDAGKLRQVLINLLGNAVKFTDRGTVRLKVMTLATPSVRFEVIDSGPGIAPEDQQRIFAPFQQEQSGATKGGTGLGLSISRAQVELMGGTIGLHSTAGSGSCFFFEIPLPPAEAPLHTHQEEHRTIAHLAPGCKVDVLVVDDVPENREILTRMLEAIGAVVRQACNGQEALNAIAERWPDIVFMDIRMPVMNGDDALRQIQADYPDRKPVCIAISASSLAHEVDYYLRLGFDRYVSKPFKLNEVFDCLSSFLDVRFEYEDAEAQPAVDADAGFVGTVRLPAQAYERLVQATERNRMTELRQALKDIETLGEPERALAEHLRRLLANIDWEGIAGVLREVKHGD